MNDHQLDRHLQSIGKECFIAYFNQFSNPQLTNWEIAELIERERGYTWKTCQSRTSGARSIIKAGRAKDAMEIIRDSEGVRDQRIRDRAARLADLL